MGGRRGSREEKAGDRLVSDWGALEGQEAPLPAPGSYPASLAEAWSSFLVFGS